MAQYSPCSTTGSSSRKCSRYFSTRGPRTSRGSSISSRSPLDFGQTRISNSSGSTAIAREDSTPSRPVAVGEDQRLAPRVVRVDAGVREVEQHQAHAAPGGQRIGELDAGAEFHRPAEVEAVAGLVQAGRALDAQLPGMPERDVATEPAVDVERPLVVDHHPGIRLEVGQPAGKPGQAEGGELRLGAGLGPDVRIENVESPRAETEGIRLHGMDGPAGEQEGEDEEDGCSV